MTRAICSTYGALWTVSVLSAGAASGGIALFEAGTPRDALDASAGTALSLIANNALVVLWPFALIALSWPAIPGARFAGDALVAAQLLMHGLTVGGAIGQRPELWRYLPHLPLEWLALALPATAWTLARRNALPVLTLYRLATVSLAALVVSAALETWAVPL